jgi:RNase adaptor protein for sRNA GlmZ degradation
MKVILMSSGKSAVLSSKVDADLFIDCRGIVNPFRHPELGKLGPDGLLKWMFQENDAYIDAACVQVSSAFKTASTRNSFKDPLKPLTVCFFCLAGQHRSPAMKKAVEVRLKLAGFTDVEVK